MGVEDSRVTMVVPETAFWFVLFCFSAGFTHPFLIAFAHRSLVRPRVPLPAPQKRDDNGEVVFLLEVPCGLVRVHVEVDDESGSARGVSFESVPSYVLIKDAEVDRTGWLNRSNGGKGEGGGGTTGCY